MALARLICLKAFHRLPQVAPQQSLCFPRELDSRIDLFCIFFEDLVGHLLFCYDVILLKILNQHLSVTKIPLLILNLTICNSLINMKLFQLSLLDNLTFYINFLILSHFLQFFHIFYDLTFSFTPFNYFPTFFSL